MPDFDLAPLNKKVDIPDVQKSYLLSELSKAVAGKDLRRLFVEKLQAFINTLDNHEIKDLTRLVSVDFRKNSVYQYTTMTNLEWYVVRTPIDDIYLTRTNEIESAILANLSIPWNLKALIAKIQKGEIEGLEDFLDKGTLIVELPIAIYSNHEDKQKIKLIDGIHRAPSMASGRKSPTLGLYLGVGV